MRISGITNSGVQNYDQSSRKQNVSFCAKLPEIKDAIEMFCRNQQLSYEDLFSMVTMVTPLEKIEKGIKTPLNISLLSKIKTPDTVDSSLRSQFDKLSELLSTKFQRGSGEEISLGQFMHNIFQKAGLQKPEIIELESHYKPTLLDRLKALFGK